MIFRMNIFTLRSPLLVSAYVVCGMPSYLFFICYFNSGLQLLKYKTIHGLKKGYKQPIFDKTCQASLDDVDATFGASEVN